jgi:DNA polymerase-1
MVIDGHSLAFRAFYALPVDSFQAPDGQHTNAIHGFISMFLGLLKKEEPTHVAVAFDVSRFSFRTRVYPDYKATRGETPSEFIGQVPLLQEALHAMGVPTITKEDYEADDILATLATRGATAGMDVLVVSGDRDTLQLVNDRVTVLYPSARGVAELKRYTPAAVIERYGVLPHQYPEIAALVGETSDNLVGVDKVGEKTAVKWIQQYGSLDNLLAHVDEITGVVGQNLRDQTDRVLRNRQLNHLLTDMDVGVSLESLARKPIDVPAVREVFTRLAFKSLTERVVALAGGDPEPESASPVARPVVELPDERLLVDEELRHWLSLNKATPLGLSVRVQGDSITECGVASATEAIRLPVINDGRDHLPLVAALGDPVFSFVSYGAKNLVKALVRQWALVPRLAGDPSLIRWIQNPSRKSDSLERRWA